MALSFEQDLKSAMPVRVAVIGAGPSGLSVLLAFEKAGRESDQDVQLVAFEKQADFGGLWNWIERNWNQFLADGNGERVHGSIYRHLYSNTPKEMLEFPDYSFEEHFGQSFGSFPPREVLYDYITGRAKKWGVQKYIRFNTPVQHVSYSEKTEKFSVQAIDYSGEVSLTHRGQMTASFNGHPSVDRLPQLTGFTRTGAVFEDGSSEQFTDVLLCTGYRHHFPFMHEDLRLYCPNLLTVRQLYKSIFWQTNPKCMYIGMTDQLISMPLFDVQATYARYVVLGRQALPDFVDRLADAEVWWSKLRDVTEAADTGDHVNLLRAVTEYQTAYMRDLHARTDYPAIDYDAVWPMVERWVQQRQVNAFEFRDLVCETRFVHEKLQDGPLAHLPRVTRLTCVPVKAHHCVWAGDDNNITADNADISVQSVKSVLRAIAFPVEKSRFGAFRNGSLTSTTKNRSVMKSSTTFRQQASYEKWLNYAPANH